MRAAHASEAVARPAAVEHDADAAALHEALAIVPQAAATLVGADRAALLIHQAGRWVLVSAFGDVPFPVGLRSHGLPETLVRSTGASAIQTMRRGDRQLGLIWVGRAEHAFPHDALRTLERLGELAVLALLQPVHDRSAPPANLPRPAATRSHHADATPMLRMDGGDLVVPAFPSMLSRIVSLSEDEDTTPAELLTAVSADPVLAAQAMQVASSPALARAKPPRSVKDALMVLGLRGVRNLAMGQFARSLFVRWDTVDQLLWEHALGAAVGMHLLLERRDPAAAEDGYLCGLLHNLGAIVLHNTHPERYQRVLARVVIGPDAWPAVEEDAFGVRSVTLLPRLIEGWHLPGRVARLLRSLADPHPSDVLATAFAWARPVGLAASPAWHHALGERPAPDWLVAETEAGRVTAGLSTDRATMLAAVVAARGETLRRLIA
jgi:HD-like signal output (HDOD) protein